MALHLGRPPGQALPGCPANGNLAPNHVLRPSPAPWVPGATAPRASCHRCGIGRLHAKWRREARHRRRLHWVARKKYLTGGQSMSKVRGSSLEGFPSGQRDQTVNLTALPSKVRILPPPPAGQIQAAQQASLLRGCAVKGSVRGCSSMVEQKPSKLMTRVRFPSPAPVLSKRGPM